ncbi:HesA/MoeB/ThiF family protein [Candidatus Woesearchaeota archaeon]|nr:HesA/MoeB/ThiF family protein [Candidatus Woesearchaeota archaeon]
MVINERYKKQELVLGKEGQKKLAKATVAVVGLGALGSNCAELLARAGIGKVMLIDRDIISLDNLQRQHLYDEEDVGKAKAVVCKEKLLKINSNIVIQDELADITWKNINQLLKNIDCIIDCTDNLFTRMLLNDFCVKSNIVLAHGAVVGNKGSLYVVSGKEKACLACIYFDKISHETCDTAGVLNTASCVVSNLQANECIKFLWNKHYVEQNFLRIDVLTNSFEKLRVKKNRNCLVCVKNEFQYLSGKIEQKAVHYCGSFQYQLEKKNFFKKEYKNIVDKLKKLGKVVDLGYCAHFDDLTLFLDGRVLIKAKDEKEARKIFDKYIGC